MEMTTAPEPVGRETIEALDRVFGGEPRVGFEIHGTAGLLLGERMDGRTGDMHFTLSAGGDVLDFTVKMNGSIRLDGRQREELPAPADILRAVLSGEAQRLPSAITDEKFEANERFSAGLKAHLEGYLDRRQVAGMLTDPQNVTATFGEEIFPDEGFVMSSEATYRIAGRKFDLLIEAGEIDIESDKLDVTIRSVTPPSADSIELDDLPHEIDMLDFEISAEPFGASEEPEHDYDRETEKVKATQVRPGEWKMTGLDAGRSYRFEVSSSPADEESDI